MRLMRIFWLVLDPVDIRRTVDFDNRIGMWLDLESEEDYDIVYVTVDEGNWNPVCILLALAVVM